MFYIEKKKSSTRWDFMLIHVLPTLIIFLAFMSITLVSRESAIKANKDQKTELINRKTAEARDAISARLTAQQDLLRSAAGFMKASDTIDRTEWRDFLSDFNLNTRFPSLQNIGYTKVLAPSEVASFEHAIQSEGFTDFTTHPTSAREIYTAVQYIEPLEGDNINSLGVDMYAEPTTRAAMELARDSNKTTLTNSVVLAQDKNNPQPSYIMYTPVYKRGAPIDTVQQRKANIDGYVFASSRTRILFDTMFQNLDKNFGIKIYDGSAPNDETLLYESSQFKKIAAMPTSEAHTEQLKINNAVWTLSVNEQHSALSLREQRRPTSILWLGILFSILIAGLIYMLLVSRTRSLAFKDEQSIQDAKDELLALASHQLRTPATGVKQYIGMLLEGYGDKISTKQETLLKKAYESNERQLSTINEMLFIARADAGEMRLDKEHVNVNQMLHDIIAEHTNTIDERKHALVTDILSTPVYVEADKKYLRMAIENIVNNAAKYTPDGGKISIALHKTENHAEVTVSDTGVGVKRKDYPLLFRKFSRIPNELTRKVSGSGIGLYLAKQVVDAHGGSIIFSSMVGKGSEFLIRIPKHSKNKGEE